MAVLSARSWGAATSSALALAALALTACALTACAAAAPGGSAGSAPHSTGTGGPANSSPPVSPAPSRSAAKPLPVAPGAGKLPQTMARPSVRSLAFHAMVTDLWLAVRTGKPSSGRNAFFPLAAYRQVKAIVNPAADWQSRLWHDFALDVHAAHRLLGPGARRARLVRVIVDAPGAAWVGPGTCYNRTGYWHVANSRVVYRVRGQERSFGIASLISWRGVWYVVHFGGVTRPAVGMVDSPASGTGYPRPQGGC